MRIAYIIAHWAIQSTLLTVTVLLITFLGILTIPGLEAALVLTALLLSTVITWIFTDLFLRIQRGRSKSLLVIVLKSLLTLLLLFWTGLAVSVAEHWMWIFVLLIFTDLFAELVLRASGGEKD